MYIQKLRKNEVSAFFWWTMMFNWNWKQTLELILFVLWSCVFPLAKYLEQVCRKTICRTNCLFYNLTFPLLYLSFATLLGTSEYSYVKTFFIEILSYGLGFNFLNLVRVHIQWYDLQINFMWKRSSKDNIIF